MSGLIQFMMMCLQIVCFSWLGYKKSNTSIKSFMIITGSMAKMMIPMHGNVAIGHKHMEILQP